MGLTKHKKPSKAQVRRFLLYCLYIVVGNAVAAAAYAFFIGPNELVMGGTTGVGIFLRNVLAGKLADEWLEWIVNLTVYALNIVLFVIGAVLLGKKFAAATLAGTLLYPTFMSIYTPLNDLYIAKHGAAMAAGDPLLATVFGSLLFGAGLGIVIRVGASTGGTDIPPLILHHYFGIPVAASMWVLDVAIVLLQLFVVSLETVLLGVLICLLSSAIIDLITPIGFKKIQVKIVSKQYRAIREMILNDLNRGVTVLFGQTGYLKEKCRVLLTIVSNRELVKLKNEVQRIDSEAFMTISVVSEVRGRGFTSEGIRLPREAEGRDEEDLEEVPPPPHENDTTVG